MKPPQSSAGDTAQAGTAVRASTGDAGRRRVSSNELLGNGREIQIEHAGELYTLRQTSKGKLILTK